MRQGELRSLGALLQKYKDLAAPERTVIDTLTAVSRELGVPIESSMCSYDARSRVVFVAHVGPVKQELRMRERSILTQCAKTLGAKNTPVRIV